MKVNTDKELINPSPNQAAPGEPIKKDKGVLPSSDLPAARDTNKAAGEAIRKDKELINPTPNQPAPSEAIKKDKELFAPSRQADSNGPKIKDMNALLPPNVAG